MRNVWDFREIGLSKCCFPMQQLCRTTCNHSARSWRGRATHIRRRWRCRYSVSRTEWTYLYGALGSWNSFVRYRRDGARCVLQWNAAQSTSAYWAAGNLPEQMRPADCNVYVPGACVSPNGTVENICAYCYVSASTGEVGLQVATTTNRNVRNCGETSWFI